MTSRSLRVAFAVLDRPGVAVMAVIAALTAAERGVLVALALVLASNDRGLALASTLALVALWSMRAMLRGGLRVRLQRGLHRRAADALLRGDPLVGAGAVDGDPEAVLLEGVHLGSVLLAERIPALVGEAVAASGIVVFLAATQPPRVLLIGGVGLLFALGAGFVTRRVTARAENESWAAYRPLLDRMLVAVRGRAELVANGADVRFRADLEDYLDKFHRHTLRAHRTSALASRVPIVAGAAGIVLALAAQDRTGVLAGAALAETALFASVVPAFVGFAQGAHESWRLTLSFRPMASLLSIPRAPTSGPTGGEGRDAPPAELAPIALRDATFRSPGASRDALTAISLSFDRGEPLVLSGPNGSGKSTVLRLIAALGAPSRGAVTVGGRDLSAIDHGAWRARVAYLPQQPHLPPAMSVREAMHLLVPDANDEQIAAALVRVGVDAGLDATVGELSTGQRKRVAIARVLLKDAAVVLLDEPDANLDAEGVDMVARIARELSTTRLVAIAAHSPAMLAAPGVHVELAA